VHHEYPFEFSIICVSRAIVSGTYPWVTRVSPS